MARQMLLMGVTPTEQIYGVLDDETMNNGVVVGSNYVNHVPLWGYLTRVPDMVSITSPVHDRLWDKPAPLRLSVGDQKKVKPFLTDVLDVKFPDVNVDDDFDLKVKSFRGPLETKAKFTRKFEPYDPDAQDGDGDGIVQDGTPWERPAASRIVDAAGRELRRGLDTATRPAGTRIVDADGKPLKYTPRNEREDKPDLGNVIGGDAPEKPSEPGLLEKPAEGKTPLSDHGTATLKERGLRSVRDITNPAPPEPKPDKKPDKVEEPKPINWNELVPTGRLYRGQGSDRGPSEIPTDTGVIFFSGDRDYAANYGEVTEHEFTPPENVVDIRNPADQERIRTALREELDALDQKAQLLTGSMRSRYVEFRRDFMEGLRSNDEQGAGRAIAAFGIMKNAAAPDGITGFGVGRGERVVLDKLGADALILREDAANYSVVFLPNKAPQVAEAPQQLVKPADIVNFADKNFDTLMRAEQELAGGDPVLGVIAALRGFDGPPRLVDFPDDLPEGLRFHRGVGRSTATLEEAARQAEMFRTGDFFPGIGLQGSGTYLTSSRLEAAMNYAHPEDTMGQRSVIDMVLDPDITIIERDEILDAVKQVAAELDRREVDATPAEQYRLQQIRRFLNDPGRLAAAMGYDGYQPHDASMYARMAEQAWGKRDHLVLLNRTVATVARKPAERQRKFYQPAKIKLDSSDEVIDYLLANSDKMLRPIVMGESRSSAGGDNILDAIYQQQGFDVALPRVVETEADLPDGESRLYRGIGGFSPSGSGNVRERSDYEQAVEYVEQFRSGRHYPGTGVSGSGTYMAGSEKMVRDYYMHPEERSSDSPRTMLVTSLRPDARLVDYEDVSKVTDAIHWRLRLMAQENPEQAARYESLKLLISNSGQVAALMGFDGMRVQSRRSESGVVVLFNRSALTVVADPLQNNPEATPPQLMAAVGRPLPYVPGSPDPDTDGGASVIKAQETFVRTIRRRVNNGLHDHFHLLRGNLPLGDLIEGTEIKSANEFIEVIERNLDEIIRKELADAAAATHHVAMPSQFLNLFFEDGRYKSQFETGSSQGLMDNDWRAEVEERALGIPREVERDMRPVYGFANNPGLDLLSQGNPYGDVVLELKPTVRGRTTVSIADSFTSGLAHLVTGELQEGDGILALPRDFAVYGQLGAESHRAIVAALQEIGASEAIIEKYLATKGADGLSISLSVNRPTRPAWNYREVQIHGGFSTDDVATIWVEDVSSIPDNLIAAAKALGLSFQQP